MALLLASGLHARTPNPIAGERIFNAAGGCGCHTAENGKPLSGGRPLKTPFGIYFRPFGPKFLLSGPSGLKFLLLSHRNRRNR